MKKITLSIIIFFCIGLIANAQNADFIWVKGLGGDTSYCKGFSSAIDLDGNVYSTGYFHSTVDFDAGSAVYNLSSSGSSDMFISKVNSQGNFEWAKKIGNSFQVSSNSICVDNTGSIYITGSYAGTVDFDPGINVHNLISGGNTSGTTCELPFVCKYDKDGNYIWAKSFSGNTYSRVGFAIKVDDNGNVYTTGYYQQATDFDPGPGVYNLSSAGVDVFVSKLNSSGDFVWAKRLGGGGEDKGKDILVDKMGNVYVTGTFENKADFNPQSGTQYYLTSSGGSDIFVCKLDSFGAFVWAKKIGGNGNDYSTSIGIDNINNIYITGSFTHSVDFDPDTSVYVLSGNDDIFVSKLDQNGDFIWAKQMGGNGVDIAQSIAITADGNSYITGFFTETADFDPDTSTFNLTAEGVKDVFVTKLNLNGELEWAKHIGGMNYSLGQSIAFDSQENVFVTGYFGGTINFDPGSNIYELSQAGYQDAFILKLGVQDLSITATTLDADSQSTPNIFTPNNDGINDQFIIPNLEHGSNIIIYDRWGIEVNNSSAEIIGGSGWDGRTTAGVECTSGVYYYIISVPNEKPLKGFVQLIR